MSRRMQIRECSSKNVGVAGYAEAFWTVQSDLQTSERAVYFANNVRSSKEPRQVLYAACSLNSSFVFDSDLLSVHAWFALSSKGPR